MRVLAFVILALVLSGCVQKSLNTPSEARKFREYFENDGSLSRISFLKLSDKSQSIKLRDIARLHDKNATFELGKMYELSKDKSSIIINLDTNKSINPNENGKINELKKAKNFKFYDFGRGILQSIIYSGKTGVCNELENGEVAIKSITNYYATYYNISKNHDDFFANVLVLKFNKTNGVSVLDYDFLYKISDGNIMQNLKAFNYSDKFKAVISSDINKQIRILFLVCKGKF